jgi:hypothetical protein
VVIVVVGSKMLMRGGENVARKRKYTGFIAAVEGVIVPGDRNNRAKAP